MSDTLTYAEAVTELLRMTNALADLNGNARWTRAEVMARPADASWCGHAYAARLRQVIEAGER